MYLSEDIKDKWDGVMKHEDLPEIKDTYKRDVTLRLLENQEQFLAEAVPTNSTHDGNSPIANWDPIMISLVRRSMPHLMAYDVCGVQPMTSTHSLAAVYSAVRVAMVSSELASERVRNRRRAFQYRAASSSVSVPARTARLTLARVN